MSTRGKFVTIEGCDGCGKSTQLAMLSEALGRRGIPCLFTREPGGSRIAERIREMLLDPANAEMTDECETLLYAAARVQHLREKVIPALEEGKLVVCDRYVDSSYAYQGEARGLGYEAVKAINRYALAPDVTIFLDLSPKEAFLRKHGADAGDRLESAGEAFHEKVYRGYLRIAEKEPGRFLCIDARKTPEKIHEEILSVLTGRGIL